MVSYIRAMRLKNVATSKVDDMSINQELFLSSGSGCDESPLAVSLSSNKIAIQQAINSPSITLVWQIIQT